MVLFLPTAFMVGCYETDFRRHEWERRKEEEGRRRMVVSGEEGVGGRE